MKVILFEGTPEEFSAASQALKGSLASPLQEVQLGEPVETATHEGRFVTLDEARKILSRIPLAKVMRQVLVKLHAAGEQKLTSEELRAATGYNANQFRGLMGAFGRRVTNTVGKNVWFFWKQWDPTTSQYNWGLPPSVRQAIEALGIQ
jgi:hypothetical protein